MATIAKTTDLAGMSNGTASAPSPSFPALFAMVGIPAILLYIATHVVIPFSQRAYPFPIEVSFFLSVGLLVFSPMLLATVFLTGKEIGQSNFQTFSQRLRLKPMRLTDWGYTVGTFMLIMITSTALMKIGASIPFLDTSLPFMDSMPLQSGTYWILAAWLPFFFVNILGEELWWRGYLLPRQENSNIKHAWLTNGIFWAVFHIGMGWSTIFFALPMFFIVPWVVQRRRNTTIAMILHALFGALGILSQAFGVG